MKLLFIIALIYSFCAQSCAEIFKRIPHELMPKLFKPDDQYIFISSILKLRLVCKVFDEKIIATINSNTMWLTKFYDFIEFKKKDSITKKEAFLLNRLPNLRTHIPFKISYIYVFLFYQDFSFCKTDEEYKALYTKQEQIVFEGLLLFDQESPTGSFTIDLASKYGWFNHGIGNSTTRQSNFCQIGFLFFDFHFYPPSSFWNISYHEDTINPVNVLISLSFNSFFKKALNNFVEQIPKEYTEEIINPVIIMNPPPMFFGQNFEHYFKNFTKPLLEKKLKHTYKKEKTEKIIPNDENTDSKINFFKKLTSLIYSYKGLVGISIGIVLIAIIHIIKAYMINI